MRARAAGVDYVVERAHAKINLHLRIVSREPDGFHKLETLFQALDLHDTLEARTAATTRLDVDGGIDTGPETDNLVLRAARAFAAEVDDAPAVAFRLTKRIPSGAGLGGGSSDAAAALRALNTIAGAPLDTDALLRLGAGLGSDVPFFLCGSPLAWATGRGERLTPRPPMPAAPVLVVDPGFAVATRDAFAWWDASHAAAEIDPLPTVADRHVAAAPHAHDFGDLAGRVNNDFESVIFERHPELRRIRDTLDRAGARVAMLSGSGACLYGLFDDETQVTLADERVREVAPRARLLHARTLA